MAGGQRDSAGGGRKDSRRPGLSRLAEEGPSVTMWTTPRRTFPVAFAVLTACLAAAAVADAAARDPAELLAAVRSATARYVDIARAREDGYVQASGMEPGHGYHFVNLGDQVLAAAGGLWRGQLDLARPPFLLYVERDGQWQLVGVEYALLEPPADDPLPGARWARHEASCHYRDYRERPGASASGCPPRHPETGAEFAFWHPAMAIAHVWAWHPNPNGLFAEDNPLLAPYAKGAAATAAHHHGGISGPEVAYSQFNHRSAGAVLLAIAAVIFWEMREGRRFPWNALSTPLWILLGIYLFARSDAEAWPMGPKSFGEIFSDPLVLQHKLLTLLPVLIGVVEGVRKAGYAGRLAWGYLFPVLGLAGGVGLFLHFHDGGLHLDRIYVQHAAMGLTSLLAGTALFVARRRGRPGARLSRAWPAFIAILGLVLLVYTEG